MSDKKFLLYIMKIEVVCFVIFILLRFVCFSRTITAKVGFTRSVPAKKNKIGGGKNKNCFSQDS